MPPTRSWERPGAPTSIEATRRTLAQTLREAGLDTPELDARILVGHALGLDHTRLAAEGASPVTPAQRTAIGALGDRRLAREPVARIVGRKEFWGLDFQIGPATLVPRPESETVVAAALEAIGDRKAADARIADLGTGSGAVLLAVLSELPSAHGVGTDVSVSALRCARHNANSLALSERAVFAACDYGSALVGAFDLVVANPPYVQRDEIAMLAPEVRLFDPRIALDGGADGLAAYRAIAAEAPRLLSPDGALVLEIGQDQAAAITAICASVGLSVAQRRNDLAGITRVLVLRPAP